MSPRARRLPLLTLALVAGGAALSSWPAAAAALRFERAALERGELWRLASAHLVHPSRALLVADLGALLVFGALQEARSRARWAALLVASALSAGLAVWFASDFQRFSGSSALVTAAVGATGVDLVRGSTRTGRVFGALLLSCCAAKCWLELRGVVHVFAPALPPNVAVAGQAHLAGALVGVVVALLVSQSCASGPCGAESSRARCPRP